jgi:hypothetical protein
MLPVVCFPHQSTRPMRLLAHRLNDPRSGYHRARPSITLTATARSSGQANLLEHPRLSFAVHRLRTRKKLYFETTMPKVGIWRTRSE